MNQLSHLEELEAEAIYIMREVVAECEKPVMLYSIGKVFGGERILVFCKLYCIRIKGEYPG